MNQKSDKKDLNKYLSNIGQEFSSKIDIISHLIGNNHYPSTGRYKERILKQVIEKFLPKRYEVGTGFVLFPSLLQPEEIKHILEISTHEISKELDIIIYDSNNYSPIYKDDDVIIVKPESVRCIIEVKSTLNTKEIKSSVQNYIDFAFKWYRFSEEHQTMWDKKARLPGLFIMGWSVTRNINRKPLISSKSIVEKIILEYQNAGIGRSYYDSNRFPFIFACFAYCDFIVSQRIRLCENGTEDFGYSTSSGKFEEELNIEFSSCGEDITVSSLLEYIDLHLDTPWSNTVYTRTKYQSNPDCFSKSLFNVTCEKN